MAGVTAQGFTVKAVSEITSDLNNSFIGAFGTQFDTSPESPDGQCIGIMASALADVWQQAEASYNAYSRSNAFGVGLDKLVELNGVTRITNMPTSVAQSFIGTSGTVIPQGYVVKTSDGLSFATVAQAIIPAVVTANCTTQGAIRILAGDVLTLTTAIPGLISTTNLAPGITGIINEEDPALRNRAEVDTISSGTSGVDAIYQAVAGLNLPYIAIIENNTAATVDGIPPNSFLTVVEGGTPQEVSQAIYDNKPQGGNAFGTIITTILDSKGYPHYIGISPPAPVDVKVTGSITNLPGASINSAALAGVVIVNYINNLNISEDVLWSSVVAEVMNKVPNIKVNASGTAIGLFTGVMGTTDLPMSAQQRARTDVSKVVVNVI